MSNPSGKFQSPLLFPVRLNRDSLTVLDETALPFEEKYHEVRDLAAAEKLVREMKTRSLGQVLLFFGCAVLWENRVSPEEIARRMHRARPTFDFEYLARLLRAWQRRGVPYRTATERFLAGFDAARKARADELASLLPSPANVLTICNVNGELLYLAQALSTRSVPVHVYVAETRPYLQGSRLTFWELQRAGVPSTLLCQSQAAEIMQQDTVNAVVTGADRATVRGDIMNKIGTYALARCARYFNIPVYALTQYPRDVDIDRIPLEERPPEEAFLFLPDSYPRVDAVYPAFDVTKKEYLTRSVELKVSSEIS
ncbi:MAG: hypothetical protein GF333_02075 [Candidatus Omnitrophica bacterium]|nr:hypothetical protein [Candidatus Omnitrophota bacterium]